MVRFFSRDYNDGADEMKYYLPVNINLRWETVAPYIALCEETYIRPLLGDSLFERLAGKYSEDPSDKESVIGVLIDKIKFALIRLSIWKGYDVINSNISDVGVSSSVDRENRLYRYQEENIKRSLKNEGFDYLDNVLRYVESHLDVFGEFSSSEYFTEMGDSLIRNTKMFNDCYSIDNSRLVFLKMRQYIRDVELIQLQHRIGVDFFNELLNADENLPKYKSILSHIRRYVVYKSVAEGIGELHKNPTERGLVFETSSGDGVIESVVDGRGIEETRVSCTNKAEAYLSAAINHIKSHKDDYPAYIGFAGDSPSDGIIRIDNTNRKVFLA